MLKERLTEEDLLKKVDDYNIFNTYFGNFTLKDSYPSVFRVDTHSSTGFYINKDGRIVYNDFRTGDKYGSIQFVMKLYGINYGKAIYKIAKDFGIIEGHDGTTAIRHVKRYKPEIKKESEYHIIVGDWTEKELDYWKDYFITEKELIDNNIHPLRKLKINDFLIENPENILKFVYIIKDVNGKEFCKIYAPHAKTKYKWCGNVSLFIPFGLYELPFKSDTLIVTKGQKDRVLLKKYFSDVIALQNESKDALTKENETFIKSNYKRIIFWFDNDTAGILALNHYKELGFETHHLPIKLLEKGIKDPSDVIKEYGLENFEKYLKREKLLI